MSLIHFKNVSKIYNTVVGPLTVLDNVSFEIGAGEFVSLVGKSGAGKSTLLRSLIAELAPSKGKVFFDEKDVHKMKHRDLCLLRRRIGMIFQDFKLLPDKTAFENVAFAMEVAGYSDKKIREDVPEVIKLVGLSDKMANFPVQLSAGEKQRIAIARALIQRPDIIVADEPTGNLDPINSWDIIKLLVKINELGTAVILATHVKEIINTIDKRVISLDKGRIIRDEERGKYLI
ncbi:MAG: ATP-binding cassette domain-containing protein [Candidatus Parcubacteria bacterium]|nr:ATP-binding cassette domain-containing protein [Candidatus Parcubacteria bacterium]